MPGGKNGKYATSVRPSLKKPSRSHDSFGGEPFKGFHAAVFIPTGAGTASGVPPSLVKWRFAADRRRGRRESVFCVTAL